MEHNVKRIFFNNKNNIPSFELEDGKLKGLVKFHQQ